MKRKLSEEEGDNAAPSQPAQKATCKTKRKEPAYDFSTDEIAKLRETEALFHSSFFRLQVLELLKNVTVKQKLQARVEDAVAYLTTVLKKLPVGKEYKISDRHWLEEKSIKLPVLEQPTYVKGSFQFMPPSNVILQGSFALATAVKPHVEADLVMEMPKESFHSKDFLNQRYTRKKGLYLAAVASHLSGKKRVDSIHFFFHQGNPLRPALKVRIKSKGPVPKFSIICLHAVPENETFKLSRFHVTKNNVRPRWFFNTHTTEPETETDDLSSLPATSFYNFSILQDIVCTANSKVLEKILAGSNGLRDGIILLKVWLRQRELLQGYGSFNSFLITAFVGSLVLKKKLNKQMNSYQVFRTTLLYLAQADWQTDPPTLCQSEPEKTQPSMEELKLASPCVFVDCSGFLSLSYMLPESVFRRVKQEAAQSLEALDLQHVNSFTVLFMSPVSFTLKFDQLFHLDLSSALLETVSNQMDSLAQESLDRGGHCSLALSSQIVDLLTKALDSRIHLVQAKPMETPVWDIAEIPPSYDDKPCLTFGLCLNDSCAFNVLDKGPLADKPESREFRDFWGDKCEMRRFKDGMIHEAVLWTDSSIQRDRRQVCRKIVHHVLARHCGIPRSSVHFRGSQLDSLLHVNLPGDQVYGTGEEQSLDILRAFEPVNKAVRNLHSLPLAIHSVQGTDPVFRHAEVFPALPTTGNSDRVKVISNQAMPMEGRSLPNFIPTMTVICMLEGSGKWPEEAEAIRCMKALFHTKMGAELRDSHLWSVQVHSHCVDVLKDGFVFRLKIANSRELAVLRTVHTDTGMVKFKDTEESISLETEIVAQPLHTHLIHGVQQRYPAMSAAMRLCKRWLAAQLVWEQLKEEAVELIIASLFLSPHPYTAPASPSVGLMRFLQLLASFNWNSEPLMVNLNKEFTEEDYVELPKAFTKNRSTLPSICLVTPQDKSGCRWTRSTPSGPMLQRLALLARESLRLLKGQMAECSAATDFRVIFRPAVDHFDLVILLQSKVNVLKHQAVDTKHEAPSVPSDKERAKVGQTFPVTNFNVVDKFVTDLKNIFGELALFFHDPFGGDAIGVVWKASVDGSKEFRPSNFTNRQPEVVENEAVTLRVQKNSIIEDIRVLGGGIIESIITPPKCTS